MRQKVQTQHDMLSAAGGMFMMAVAAVIGVLVMALNVWVGLVIVILAVLAFVGNLRLFRGRV